eukprot:gene4033-2887_t
MTEKQKEKTKKKVVLDRRLLQSSITCSPEELNIRYTKALGYRSKYMRLSTSPPSYFSPARANMWDISLYSNRWLRPPFPINLYIHSVSLAFVFFNGKEMKFVRPSDEEKKETPQEHVGEGYNWAATFTTKNVVITSSQQTIEPQSEPTEYSGHVSYLNGFILLFWLLLSIYELPFASNGPNRPYVPIFMFSRSSPSCGTL